MNSIKKIFENLRLINLRKTSVEKDFFYTLYSSKNSILQWYPSAGRDLKNIAFYYSNAFKKKELNIEIPNLFVHTDFNYDETFELQTNDIYTETLENEVFKITVIERCEYDTNFTPYFDANYEAYRNNSMDGKALLLKLNIETENKDSHVVYLLYCYLENINFFKKIIIKSKVSIDQLCTIREGSGLGGGGVISNKIFAFYLGYMQCKYWFTDVIGRNVESMTKLNEEDTILEDTYNNVYNKSTVLTGLMCMDWSNYGSFQGDAHVYRVETLHMPNNEDPEYSEEFLDLLHKSSEFNKADLIGVKECACFSCISYFKAEDVMLGDDKFSIPQCPYCSVDSVLRETPEVHITDRLLKKMRAKYFGN
jgi:hypothetical protein